MPPRPRRRPFIISSEWIYYAHNPGAESGQPTARKLIRLSERSERVSTKTPYMVREIVSVAELYSGGPAWDDDEKALRRRASGIVRRGRAWLDVYDT